MKLNKLIAVLMLVVLAFGLTACGSKEQSIVGKWSLDADSMLAMSGEDLSSMSEEEKELMKGMLAMMSMTMEFTADGKAIMSMTMMGETETEETTYSLEDGKLVMEGEPAEYKVEGDKLSITAEGQTLVMTKVK